MTTKRDEIIRELGDLVKTHSNSGISHKLSYTMKRWELELVSEWIIKDRRRIVEPLRATLLDKNFPLLTDSLQVTRLYDAGFKVLSNAGLTEE